MQVGKQAMVTAALSAAVMSQVACGQIYTPGYTPGAVYYTAPPVAPAVPVLNEQQLEQLVAPVALYPDPLLGEVLAAATYPNDVGAAASWVQTYPNQPDDVVNTQPWEPSVKSLVHYPSVLAMMGSHLDWTAALGSAFLNQQQDLLGAVQQLRLRAQTAGNLANTPQQQVVVDNGYVDIVPVGNVIYVPAYDLGLVYAQPCVIDYGVHYGIGPWLDIDFDWAHRGLREGHRWDQRFDVHDDHAHERAWVRNYERPLPVIVGRPGEIVRPKGVNDHAVDPHRGYVPPPAPPGAFGGVQPRNQVEQERARGAQPRGPAVVSPPPVRPVPPPVRPVPPPVRPQPTPVPPPRPVSPTPVPPPRPVQPAPAPPPRPAQPGVFQGGSRGQSDRGHASMGHK